MCIRDSAGTHRPARGVEGAWLAALFLAFAQAEHTLQHRERRLKLLGVGVGVGRFGLEGTNVHAHGGVGRR
eukprot:13342891-Alexandrium_andersonii.AAC.1